MALAYSIGLLALAGLLIPVFIHLWSVKKGKTFKIGSIALLGENATSSARNLKLTDLLLFILRCLIIILIAFLLAEPYFKKTNLNSGNKGWILMDKSQVGTVYKGHQPTIDSLLSRGFELRDFNLGFNSFELKDSTKAKEATSTISYTALIGQLDKEMPKGHSAYIFADQRMVKFDGNLSKPNFNLVWKDVRLSDTLKTWSTTFLGKAYEAKSTPTLTSYRSNSSQNLPVVTVSIYNPNNDDAKYIQAALRAITDFTKRKFEVITSVRKADMVFWLSDELIPSSLHKVIAYKNGKVEPISSTLQLSSGSNSRIELEKRVASDTLTGEVIWKDGYGEPLLIKKANTEHFYFYSRFNPQWNDLVWDEQFVGALIPIIFSDTPSMDFGFEEHDADQRRMGQVPFLHSKISTSGTSILTTHQSLSYPIWAIIFLLLIIERILSFNNKTKLENAKR